MLANGILQTTTTTGPGNLTLAASGAFMPFSAKFSAGANGDPFFYVIVRASDGVGVEWGIGHLADGSTLVRDKVLATWDGTTYNDQNPTAANLSAGTYNVECADMSAARPIALQATDPAINATQRLILSDHYVVVANAGATLNGGNSGVVVPFNLVLPATVNGVVLQVNTAATTGTAKTARAAIYRIDKNGHPGNKVAETLSVPVTTGSGTLAKMAFATPIRLDAGWYFVALCTDSNAVFAVTNQSAMWRIPMWGVGSSAGNAFLQATFPLTYADSGPLFPGSLSGQSMTFGTAGGGALPQCPMLAITS